MMTKDKWYSSAEHFRTEMSYGEYVKAQKIIAKLKKETKKKPKKKTRNILDGSPRLKMPSFSFGRL